MPNSKEDVKEFFQRISVLETQVKGLMTFQKWQMALLAAILLFAIKNWAK